MGRRMRLSVVVPVFNEEGNLRELHRRLRVVLPTLAAEFEIIFVDDGSRDGTLAVLEELAGKDSAVKYLSFSRNFGHEIASSAGLDHAGGDAVVLMDGDLQDPPEAIGELVARWREGFDVVYAVRRSRQGEGVMKRLTATLFYRLLRRLSGIDLPLDAGDFRLMDRKVVEGFRRFRERERFVRGLVAWMGFRQASIEYDRPARHAGRTKYNFWKLMVLAGDAISGFSLVPLRIAAIVGLVVTAITGVAALAVVVRGLVSGFQGLGPALVAAALLFLGGVQLAVLGLLGAYVGKIYREAQERPLYLIRRQHGFDHASPVGSAGG